MVFRNTTNLHSCADGPVSLIADIHSIVQTDERSPFVRDEELYAGTQRRTWRDTGRWMISGETANYDDSKVVSNCLLADCLYQPFGAAMFGTRSKANIDPVCALNYSQAEWALGL